MSNFRFELADVRLAHGDHLCALYSGSQERNAILAPYLSAGLEAGEKCVVIVETADQPGLLAAMERGANVTEAVDEQLILLSAADSYLRGGAFSIARTLQLWSGSLGSAADGGFVGVRGAGDANGLVDHPDVLPEFSAYDSELNRFALDRQISVMCSWDLQRFGGNIVADLLRTHPRILLGGRVLESPYFVGCDRYLVERVEPAWRQLSEELRGLAERAARGLTNVELADALSVSQAAVDRHLHRIYRALGIFSRGDLTSFVRALGVREQ